MNLMYELEPPVQYRHAWFSKGLSLDSPSHCKISMLSLRIPLYNTMEWLKYNFAQWECNNSPNTLHSTRHWRICQICSTALRIETSNSSNNLMCTFTVILTTNTVLVYMASTWNIQGSPLRLFEHIVFLCHRLCIAMTLPMWFDPIENTHLGPRLS